MKQEEKTFFAFKVRERDKKKELNPKLQNTSKNDTNEIICNSKPKYLNFNFFITPVLQ